MIQTPKINSEAKHKKMIKKKLYLFFFFISFFFNSIVGVLFVFIINDSSMHQRKRKETWKW